jgi:hypothetical protein
MYPVNHILNKQFRWLPSHSHLGVEAFRRRQLRRLRETPVTGVIFIPRAKVALFKGD